MYSPVGEYTQNAEHVLAYRVETVPSGVREALTSRLRVGVSCGGLEDHRLVLL